MQPAPDPAIVVSVPDATMSMRTAAASAMKSAPAASEKESERGPLSVAPPSAAPSTVPATPVPATVCTIRDANESARTRLFSTSATYNLAPSSARPTGPLKRAATPGPSLKPQNPVPAMTVDSPVATFTEEITQPADSATQRVPPPNTHPLGALKDAVAPTPGAVAATPDPASSVAADAPLAITYTAWAELLTIKVAPEEASKATSAIPTIVASVDTFLLEEFKTRSVSLPSSTKRILVVASRIFIALGVKILAAVPAPSTVAAAPEPATKAVVQRAVGDGSAERPCDKHDDGHAQGVGGTAPPGQKCPTAHSEPAGDVLPDPQPQPGAAVQFPPHADAPSEEENVPAGQGSGTPFLHVKPEGHCAHESARMTFLSAT